MTNHTLAVIGAGLAGEHAAVAARSAGFEGRIVLVGEEADPPYERPPLSKSVLRNEAQPDSALVRGRDDYPTFGIELQTGLRVDRLDTDRRRLVFADGDSLPYTAAILATGCAPRRLEVAGADLDGVRYLRTLRDAVTLRDSLATGARVAVIGAGWIGSEVAASARQVGCEVALIGPGPVPLHRALGPDIGRMFRDLHRDHGVELRLNTHVARLSGHRVVEAVELADGTRVEADLVVVGIGVTPRTGLARAAGLVVDDGILVDEQLRTEVPDVYAGGDVARAWHPLYQRRIRVEHWANAIHQGETAGRNVAGMGLPYDRLPYFYSDQYDLGIEYVGHHQPGDVIRFAGDTEQRKFIAYWERADGSVSAAMSVNLWGVVDDLKAAVLKGKPPTVALHAFFDG